MHAIFCILLGYLIGSISPSYLISRSKGVDIRKSGSKNAGASNVLLLFGKGYGIFCAFFDIGKAYLSVTLAELLFPQFSYALPLTATACIYGHIFPFYMGFRGGKGLACLGGVFLRFDPLLTLLMLAGELLVVLITDYLCFVPITGSAALPILYGAKRHDWIGAGILALCTVVMVYRHLENLRHIRQGAELHFSCLWRPQYELERIQKHLQG